MYSFPCTQCDLFRYTVNYPIHLKCQTKIYQYYRLFPTPSLYLFIFLLDTDHSLSYISISLRILYVYLFLLCIDQYNYLTSSGNNIPYKYQANININCTTPISTLFHICLVWLYYFRSLYFVASRMALFTKPNYVPINHIIIRKKFGFISYLHFLQFMSCPLYYHSTHD